MICSTQTKIYSKSVPFNRWRKFLRWHNLRPLLTKNITEVQCSCCYLVYVYYKLKWFFVCLNSFLTSNSNCKVKLLQLDTNSPDNNYSSDPFTFHASSLCSHIWSESNHVSFEIPEILNIVFRSS